MGADVKTAHRERRSKTIAKGVGLLLSAEHATDIGARIMRLGRSHIGALIDTGDRDFATDVDLQEAVIGLAVPSLLAPVRRIVAEGM